MSFGDIKPCKLVNNRIVKVWIFHNYFIYGPLGAATVQYVPLTSISSRSDGSGCIKWRMSVHWDELFFGKDCIIEQSVSVCLSLSTCFKIETTHKIFHPNQLRQFNFLLCRSEINTWIPMNTVTHSIQHSPSGGDNRYFLGYSKYTPHFRKPTSSGLFWKR